MIRELDARRASGGAAASTMAIGPRTMEDEQTQQAQDEGRDRHAVGVLDSGSGAGVDGGSVRCGAVGRDAMGGR
ncbi:hypothetical protein SHIRM173S_02680 [Streptomyces hirsutus]